MAQKTAWTGATLTQSDINTYLMGEGGAWTSWTPTVTQSGSVTVTNTRSRYARYGRTIIYTARLKVTGSGTGANAVIISAPVTAASSLELCGTGVIYDSSATTYYPGIAQLTTTSTIWLFDTRTSTSAPILGTVGFTAGLANNDEIYVAGSYEAAS